MQVIRSKNTELLYWSNQDGWVHRKSATIFTETERAELNLPIDGIWERVLETAEEREVEYLKNSGGKCLFCLSPNIVGNTYQGDGNTVWCEVTCDDCSRAWQDNYTLTGVLDLCTRGKLSDG